MNQRIIWVTLMKYEIPNISAIMIKQQQIWLGLTPVFFYKTCTAPISSTVSSLVSLQIGSNMWRMSRT